MPSTNQLAVFTLTIKQIDTLTLPSHSGSMLRGAFGTALRELSCLTGLPDCKACPLNTLCPYTQIFELVDNNKKTNPYVLRLPSAQTVNAGNQWQFGISLFGQALEHVSLIMQAWQQAFRLGIGGGQSRACGTLVQISNLTKVLYTNANNPNANNPTAPITIDRSQLVATPNFIPKEPIFDCTLRFVSPVRIQYQGKIIHRPQSLSDKALFLALYNRIKTSQTIAYPDYDTFANAIATISTQNQLQPIKVTRYSSRQQRKITLFGLIGRIAMTTQTDALTQLLPLLWTGQYLHIGKSTTLGMGQYQLAIRQNTQKQSVSD